MSQAVHRKCWMHHDLFSTVTTVGGGGGGGEGRKVGRSTLHRHIICVRIPHICPCIHMYKYIGTLTHAFRLKRIKATLHVHISNIKNVRAVLTISPAWFGAAKADITKQL